MSTGIDQGGAPPVITVVRGEPTPAELAALVTVLLALGGAEAETVPDRPSAWADRTLVPWPRPGAQAWRASARPR
ncbi:MAG TPA: acyl-CoA carboxylase subunit epsilon [Trebonia sp.]